MGVGRGPASFKVESVHIRVFPIQEEPDYGYLPSVGRYFHDWEKNPEYTVADKAAYVLVRTTLKKNKRELTKIFAPLLKEYPVFCTVAVALMFKGFPGEDPDKQPSKLGESSNQYFFNDLAGLDVEINGKLLHIPEARLIENSDFQIHLKGTQGPARPNEL